MGEIDEIKRRVEILELRSAADLLLVHDNVTKIQRDVAALRDGQHDVAARIHALEARVEAGIAETRTSLAALTELLNRALRDPDGGPF